MYVGYRSAMVCFPSRHLILYLATSKHLKEMAVAVTIDFNNTYEIEPEDVQPMTARITKNQFIRPDFMYNYFIFELKERA
jgi:hypothetical protein